MSYGGIGVIRELVKLGLAGDQPAADAAEAPDHESDHVLNSPTTSRRGGTRLPHLPGGEGDPEPDRPGPHRAEGLQRGATAVGAGPGSAGPGGLRGRRDWRPRWATSPAWTCPTREVGLHAGHLAGQHGRGLYLVNRPGNVVSHRGPGRPDHRPRGAPLKGVRARGRAANPSPAGARRRTSSPGRIRPGPQADDWERLERRPRYTSRRATGAGGT